MYRNKRGEIFNRSRVGHTYKVHKCSAILSILYIYSLLININTVARGKSIKVAVNHAIIPARVFTNNARMSVKIKTDFHESWYIYIHIFRNASVYLES